MTTANFSAGAPSSDQPDSTPIIAGKLDHRSGLRSTVAVVAVISAIWTANGFENIWLMTQGGPSTTTMTFPVLSFLSLQSRQLGQAAAYAVVILPIMALFIMLLSRRKKDI